MYFQGIQESEFFIFSQDCTQSWEVPPHIFQLFRGSCYNIHYKPYAISKIELFMTKIGITWKLLLTVVTESFVLNVMGLLDLTLKHITKEILFFKSHAENEIRRLVPILCFFEKALYEVKTSGLQFSFNIFRQPSTWHTKKKKKLYKTLRKLLIQRYAPF